ncbi:lytic transglycosylase domain-containing protein [Sabulicella glaciei]|uniref:Lytic transglycosylase domain-containing protein n=1 Tax=Sabulicella glaciei TaxID=2984948 RepID=A0ABT3P141_9PROT|nr:lytic transglycosylase domain-containing protein [Roseococcus sp. MDT2-1-1]MCW8088121.1 lytic transglycosylase domain-containing protein [Roseococcus sp. MDT2-1-1]
MRRWNAKAVARPVAAFAMLGLLAACGGGGQAPTTRSSGSYTQARSYDPPGPRTDPWGPYIREASRRFDVPEGWIREVMRQESGGRATATSPVGAMGLMQVMPGTYRELQARHGLGDDPYHPYDSIMAGTAYIRQMYDLYGSPAFLAAYNAGPRRLEDYLYNSRGLPTETRNYVARVGPGVIRSSPVRRAPSEVYAAAEIPLRVPPGPRRMDSTTRFAIAEQQAIREGNAQYARLPDPEPSSGPRMMAAAPAPASRGGVVAMEPIPDGSTPQGAIRLAEAEGRALAESGGGAYAAPSGDVLPDGRIVVARMDPIPDGSTPEGAVRLAESNARSEAPFQTAALGGSFTAPPSAPLPPPAARVTARAQAAAPTSAQPLPPRTLGFISVAQAGTLPASFRPAVATSAGSWAVQVGAFNNPTQARAAAQAAQGTAGGQVAVTPVQVGRSTLFRARVTGLSQNNAQQACERLRRNGACNVLSPDAQS